MNHDRPANIASDAAIPWQDEGGDVFAFRRKQLSQATGGRELGCSLFELLPQRRSFPHHYHLGNEEALYVLAGNGEVRLGDERWPIGPGDYVALRAGADHAHQVIAGDEPLRYLCISTMREPDIVIYPDSEKAGLFAGVAPGGPEQARTVCEFLSRKDPLPYYHGEQ